MKKLILSFLLSFLLVVNAWAGHFIRTSGGGASPCMTGTYRLAWDGDYTADTDAACDDAAAKVNGAVNGSLQIGTSYGEGGSVGIQADNAPENIEWSDSGDDHIDGSGSMTYFFRLYISAVLDEDTTFYFAWDDNVSYNNFVYCDVDVNRTIQCAWRGNGTQVTHNSTDTIFTTTWTTIAFAVDNSSDDISIKIGAGSWSDLTSGTVSNMTLDIAEIKLGTFDNDPGDTEYIRLDRHAIVTGYKASEPSGW